MPEWMKNALLAVFAVVVLAGATVAVRSGGLLGLSVVLVRAEERGDGD